MDIEIAQDARNYIVDRHIGDIDNGGWEILYRQMDAGYIDQYYRCCATLDEAIEALKDQAEKYDRWALNAEGLDAFDGFEVDPYAGDDDEFDCSDDQEDEAYHDWVSDRGMSIFNSGAASEEAMFMARQEASQIFPEAHQRACRPARLNRPVVKAEAPKPIDLPDGVPY